jgi:hydrogenase maturation protease
VKSAVKLLVIGYGNTLRQDDQAGPAVAEAIEARALPGVCTLVCAQLSPEHAEAVAAAESVVFVDAQAGAPQEVMLEPIEPGTSCQVTTHAVEPPTMLALAREVYGRMPAAWLVTIPTERLGFGPELSETTRQGIARAINLIISLAQPGTVADCSRTVF